MIRMVFLASVGEWVAIVKVDDTNEVVDYGEGPGSYSLKGFLLVPVQKS